MLLAAYKGYTNNYAAFLNENQSNAFSIRVLGLINTMLPPEIGKDFCAALDYDMNRKIDKRAQSLMLDGNIPFYRSSRNARTGAGFHYLRRGISAGNHTDGDETSEILIYFQTKERSGPHPGQKGANVGE